VCLRMLCEVVEGLVANIIGPKNLLLSLGPITHSFRSLLLCIQRFFIKPEAVWAEQ